MIYIMKKCWDRNNKKLREVLSERTDLNSCSYKDLVKITFEVIFNNDEYNDDIKLDLEHMTEIDDGSYQGTILWAIPFDTYQPSANEYLMTHIEYGSCSCCDTLQGIQGYSEEKPTKEQLNEFMMLCKDFVCNAIKPYNHGWRHNDMYDPVEEDNEHSPLAHPERYVEDSIAIFNDMTTAQRKELLNHIDNVMREGE